MVSLDGLVAPAGEFSDATRTSETVEFDPANFAKRIFSSIDDHRSHMGPLPTELVETPVRQGAASTSESKMNAFFRLIGLPAVRDESKITDGHRQNERKERVLSQDSTLNYHSFGSGLAGQVAKKEIILSEKLTVERYNQLISQPLKIDESLNDASTRRPCLFPLVVDASVAVYPKDKRVAPLFYDGDYIMLGGSSRLKRPFLQHVLYMRLKLYSGSPTQIEQDLMKNILAEVGEDIISESDLLDFKFLELQVIEKIVQTIKQSAKEYNRVRSKLRQLQANISYAAVPSDNPELRTGSMAVDNNKKFASSLDAQLQSVRAKLNKIDGLLLTLPIERINRSDRIRRLSDEVATNSFSPDAFIGEFTSLLTFDRAALEKSEQELMQERSRNVQRLEQARRDIQYYTGEFTGLSIFDILGVFYALFTVPVDVLIGLLNEDAKNRLLADPFFSSSEQAVDTIQSTKTFQDIVQESSMPVLEALSQLEVRVEDSFRIATTYLERITVGNRSSLPLQQSTQ